MDVSEKIITSSTVQANISYLNEDEYDDVEEEQEQVELGAKVYEQGENYQLAQDSIGNEQTQKKEWKVRVAEWLAYAFWLFSLALAISAVQRLLNLFR